MFLNTALLLNEVSKKSETFARDHPQSEHWVTNFFAYRELHCEECGEVLVTNFKTIFAGRKLTEHFATKKSTSISLQNIKFHHHELPGPLSRKKFETKCPKMLPIFAPKSASKVLVLC